MSNKEIEQVKAKEGQRLLAKIKPQATVITLEIAGNAVIRRLSTRITTTYDPRPKRLHLCYWRIKRIT